MIYILNCQDIVTSNMYLELLLDEFSLKVKEEYKPNNNYKFLALRRHMFNKEIYHFDAYIDMRNITNSIIIDTFKEFREIVNKHKDKIKRYEDI